MFHEQIDKHSAQAFLFAEATVSFWPIACDKLTAAAEGAACGQEGPTAFGQEGPTAIGQKMPTACGQVRAASGQVFTPALLSPLYTGCCKCCRCKRKKHRCNKILTGRKGKYGRMRREGGAQGREGVRRGKGEWVYRGGRDGLVGLVQTHLPGQRPSRGFEGDGREVLAGPEGDEGREGDELSATALGRSRIN